MTNGTKNPAAPYILSTCNPVTRHGGAAAERTAVTSWLGFVGASTPAWTWEIAKMVANVAMAVRSVIRDIDDPPRRFGAAGGPERASPLCRPTLTARGLLQTVYNPLASKFAKDI